MHAMLTTDVANYIVEDDQVAQATRDALEFNKHHLQLWNGQCELIQSIGDKTTVPRIWTHKPIPMRFPIIEVQAEFEATACNVLGDYDNTPNFDKCGQYDDTRTNSYNDNRYVSESVRAAWMMYLTLAIKHFNESK